MQGAFGFGRTTVSGGRNLNTSPIDTQAYEALKVTNAKIPGIDKIDAQMSNKNSMELKRLRKSFRHTMRDDGVFASFSGK
jgi:hypothetical protein